MKTRIAVFLIVASILLFFPAPSAAQWVQTAGPEGCHVVSLSATGGKVFAVVEGYGLFMSAGNGTRWTAVKTGLPPGHDVTLVEWINGTLFAGTNAGLVLFSTDDGAGWKQINIGPKESWRPAVICLALVGTDLFVGSQGGVYVCPDYSDGATAVSVGLPKLTGIRSLAVIGSDVFAGQLSGPVLLFKKNAGVWTRSTFPSPGFRELICLEALGTDLLAGADDGVFLSSDKGASWNKISSGLPKDPYVSCLGGGGSDILAGLSQLMVPGSPSGIRLSRGRGGVWTVTDLGLKNADIDCFASAGKNVFAGTTNGVFRSPDGGSTWMPANMGLPVASSVSALLARGQNLIAVTSWTVYMGGGTWLSPDNGRTWKPIGPDLHWDSMVACLAESGPNLFAGISRSYVWGEDGKRDGVCLSPNNGRSWITVSSGLPSDASVCGLAVIGQAIYAATEAGIVFISRNNGASWEACSDGLPAKHSISCLVAAGQDLFAGIPESSYELPAMSMAPGGVSLSVGGQFLFAGGPPPTGRLFLLTKGALKWKDTRIRLSRAVNSLAKIGTALFLGTGRGLYLCEDYSKDPKPLKLKTSPDISVRCLVLIGTGLIVGTDHGVHIVKNDGEKWKLVDAGLPKGISVSCFAMTETDLFAGTSDRGVWKLPLSALKNQEP